MTTVTETIRLVARSELPVVINSLAAWHAATGDYSLQQTFPQVYRPDGQAIRIGVFDGEQLVSHAAVHTVRLTGPQGDAIAGLIGAVGTDPEARGRGLASRLLSAIIARSREQRFDAMLLWSDRRRLYERLGFLPAGRQEEVLLRDCRSSGRVRPASVRDIVAIHHLHERKPYRVRRQLQDTALLLSVEGMSTVVLERGTEVIAYACCGKGADFPNWWHEVGGTDRDVAELLGGAMESLHQDRAMLLLPPYRTDLKRILGGDVLHARETHCALRLALTAAGQREFYVDGLDSI